MKQCLWSIWLVVANLAKSGSQVWDDLTKQVTLPVTSQTSSTLIEFTGDQHIQWPQMSKGKWCWLTQAHCSGKCCPSGRMTSKNIEVFKIKLNRCCFFVWWCHHSCSHQRVVLRPHERIFGILDGLFHIFRHQKWHNNSYSSRFLDIKMIHLGQTLVEKLSEPSELVTLTCYDSLTYVYDQELMSQNPLASSQNYPWITWLS